ncbi:MAG: hypothetical protein WDW36_004746 [Sanguina aurantia]
MVALTADEGDAPPKPKARMLLDALAGSIAGAISRVCIGPLDVIKIRFQVQLEPIAEHGPSPSSSIISGGKPAPRAPSLSKYTGLKQALFTIVKEEGIQGLWRGTVPGLLLTVPYTAVQFVALHQCKDLAARHGLSANGTGPLISFASGAVAGAAATIASYPFDLLRTTLAAQGEPKVYRGTLDAARAIIQARGVSGLYSGLGVTLVEIIPYAAIQFGMYDALNLAWTANRHNMPWQRHPVGGEQAAPHSTRLQNFTCGLVAGVVSKLLTHPLDVAKKRYQIAGLPRSLSYGARVEADFALRSLGASLHHIFKAEGVAGLWKGSIPSIAKAAPSAAITFTAYEFILAWLLVRTATADSPAALPAEQKVGVKK